MSYAKKHWCMIFLFICFWVVLILGIPIIINLLLPQISSEGTNDGWLGFWGGYLGSMFAIPISIGVAILSIRMENEQSVKTLEESKKVEYKLEKIKRENRNLDAILIAATNYQVEVSKFTNLQINGPIFLKSTEVLINETEHLLNEEYARYFSEYSIARAKLPNQKRKVLDIKNGELVEKIDDVSNLVDDLSVTYSKIKKVNEDQTINKGNCLFDFIVNVQSHFKKIETILGDLSDISSAQIDANLLPQIGANKAK